MANLLDIAPAHATVPIGGQDIDVYGLTVEDVVGIIGRFPALAELMTASGGPKPDDILSDPLSLIQWAPQAVRVILAAGTGHAGDTQHESAAARLSIDSQADLLGKIMELTLPGGVSPLARKVTAIFLSVADLDSTQRRNVSSSKPPSLPNGKGADTSLQLPSNG